MSGTVRGDAAESDAEDVGIQQQRLFNVMGDRDRGYVTVVEMLDEAGQELVAHVPVDAGKGFVQKDEAGFWHGKGARQVDALLFAS